MGGSSIAERGMEPDAVVEADDVVGDVSDCFGVIGIVGLKGDIAPGKAWRRGKLRERI